MAILVRVVEPLAPPSLPSLRLLPRTTRATISRQIAAENRSQITRARRELARLTTILRRAGWRVQTVIRSGVPLADVARTAEADILVVGARGAGGLERLLLGSVADGVLRHADSSVLVVR
jgi:nucleotide-binding universal stress UspA family protein